MTKFSDKMFPFVFFSEWPQTRWCSANKKASNIKEVVSLVLMLQRCVNHLGNIREIGSIAI